eukprot:CAMPEP_0202956624 /NCGR_PEP_ID=MMETSP1396-20130829/1121_1 /ASSEMBLY_ACC=CAM_ASM_000872 /TAXON_ID= /ORGANISM="Pseudokeronopsis sp., Strain Brazil" /LENGTH=103 /DNA_ID=CAMNT_0049673727 /DNA_START=248 /DNA_END=559 /DNA_ORIENTATION=-
MMRFEEEKVDYSILKHDVEEGCRNRGNRTLETILIGYLKSKGNNIGYTELEEINIKILTLSNAQLYKYLLEGAPVDLESDSKALRNLIEMNKKSSDSQELSKK